MIQVVAKSQAEVKEIVKQIPNHQAFDPFLSSTPEMWVGYDGEDRLVCVWGLIPPTLMSDRAYLWLYTTEALQGNEFSFIRHSQRWLEEALKEWPVIFGHTDMTATQSIRWIKLCGGVYGEPEGGLVPFVIRRKSRG